MAKKRPTPRRAVRLADGGRFDITPKTARVDVSCLCDDGKPRTLHVSRTKAALECRGVFVSVHLDEAVRMLDAYERKRPEHGGPDVESLFDRRVLLTVRRQAEHMAAARRLTAPIGERGGRICWQSRGPNPNQCLWMDKATGDMVLETLTPELDARGRPCGSTSSVRAVTEEEALEWIRTEWRSYAGPELEPLLEAVQSREWLLGPEKRSREHTKRDRRRT